MILFCFAKSCKKIILIIILFSTSVYCRGQKLTITDTSHLNNANIIILSEWHLSDFLPTYKRKLIEKLHAENGMTDLILEIGKSSAYLLNEYIQTGDTSITDIWTHGNYDFLNKFRKNKLPSGKPLKISGIDFERMDIVPALKRVLEKTGNTKNELFEYLTTLPDTILNLDKYDILKAERSAIIQNCKSIYKSNVKYYSSIYDNGFIVKEICENPVVETEWDKRFEAMSNNLRMLYSSKLHKYLLIVGINHIDCPNPIFEELVRVYNIRENDIVNIALVVKDCEAKAMYKGRGEVRLASSKSILNEPGLTDSLYKSYSFPCNYQLIHVRTKFPNYKPSFKCDYILPIDCKFDVLNCD